MDRYYGIEKGSAAGPGKSVEVHALCTSYYHLLQAIAFTLVVGREAPFRKLFVYSAPFLGKARVDPSCLTLAKLPLDVNFREIPQGAPVSPLSVVRRICSSLACCDGQNFVISANTINLWFVSYMNRIGIKGRFGVFEDGIGAYGSPLYRARDQAKLSGRKVGLIFATEIFRLAATALAVRQKHNVRVLGNLHHSAHHNYFSVLRGLFERDLFKAEAKRAGGPLVVLLSQPVYLTSDISKSQYHDLLRRTLDTVRSKGFDVIIKPHPNDELPLDIEDKVLDFAGPAEALVAKLLPTHWVCVAGFSSTALLSCRRLFGIASYRVEAPNTDSIYAELDRRTRLLLFRETRPFPAEFPAVPVE